MKLRTELEPNIERAEELFTEILSLISKFDSAFDQGDEDLMDTTVNQLNELTGKSISKDDLYEYWGYTSIEDLAFDISLPSPQKVENITNDEVIEIKRRIETIFEQSEDYFKKLSPFLIKQGATLVEGLDNYYNELLDKNIPTPPDKVIYL
ncbi:hypothetical protein [uncultured Aquimarina sp.]|uniref:hypothetical protein n=1 Tax=uncultured Aquimarina sp. TaxID=575652 RepID=UPI00260C1AE2|nr:hypothetical protein [uncultured Aquimarina sp.]